MFVFLPIGEKRIAQIIPRIFAIFPSQDDSMICSYEKETCLSYGPTYVHVLDNVAFKCPRVYIYIYIYVMMLPIWYICHIISIYFR